MDRSGTAITFPEAAAVVLAGDGPFWKRFLPLGPRAYAIPGGVLFQDAEDVKLVLSDGRFGRGELIPKGRGAATVIESDAARIEAATDMAGFDQDHARLRRLIAPALAAPALAIYYSRMAEVMRRLLVSLRSRSTFDAVADLLTPFAFQAMATIFGVGPRNAEAFCRAGQGWVAWLRGGPDNFARALAAHSTLDVIIGSEIDSPSDGGLIALLRSADADGDRLSPLELKRMLVRFMTAGPDPVQHALGNAIVLLAQGDHWRTLASAPELTGPAIAEVLRVAPISPSLHRVALSDVDVRSIGLTAGQRAHVSIAAVNYDPKRFANPTVFDIRRVPTRPLMTFGYGPHACAAARLTQEMLTVALSTLVEHNAAIEPLGVPIWRPPGGVQGPVALPVRFRHC